MTGRIRGHYRIDSTGHVQPLGDVNGAAKPYSIPLPVLKKHSSYRTSRFGQISMAGIAVFVTGISLMILLPQIQRAILSAQNARIAAVRAAYMQTHPALESLLEKHR